MGNRNLTFITLMAAISLLILSCAGGSRIAGSSKKCGCGLHKGLTGY
jgi:hypothetical protein